MCIMCRFFLGATSPCVIDETLLNKRNDADSEYILFDI